MYDERFCRMWEFYLISAEMMFRTGSQLVFHMQLARKRDAVPIVRDYVTDLQRRYREMEADRLAPLATAQPVRSQARPESGEGGGQGSRVPASSLANSSSHWRSTSVRR